MFAQMRNVIKQKKKEEKDFDNEEFASIEYSKPFTFPIFFTIIANRITMISDYNIYFLIYVFIWL